MQSHNSALISKSILPHLPIFRSRDRPSSLAGTFRGLESHVYLKVCVFGSGTWSHGFLLRPKTFNVNAMDEGSLGISSFSDWEDIDRPVGYAFSSSEGEDSDGEMLLQPITDVDLPMRKEHYYPTDDSITLAAHQFAMLGRAQKKRKSIYGILNNFGIVAFLMVVFSVVDSCAWRIVRLPLEPFYLIRPFAISLAMVCFVGYICVPLLRGLKLQSIIRKGPARHSCESRTPTMGGLYFIPIGIVVAEVIVGFSSIEVSGAAAITLSFAAIGFIDDLLSLESNSNGLSAKMRVLLEMAATTCFLCWLYITDISSPYSMYTFLKMVVPMPAPLGLLCLGKFYSFLTLFCFVSMPKGVNLTDGLDGLAGGTAALAFTGMSIAVLPICSDLSVFGASMAGACVGFLFHNRYKASVFMGDTGAFALGGALAAMAACSGMFFPLFISSGIFVVEALSVIMQVSFFKATKHWRGTGYRLFQMAPFHRHLKLCGIKEPIIVAGAYVISFVLALYAGYIGLVSA